MDLLKDSKVIICVGGGGVGKTTLAATLGLIAAQRQKKVMVLTIDPSKRLMTTLNLNPELGRQCVKKFADGGELWAEVLNSKKVFDDFVLRAAEKVPGADKILQNKLYQQLSTTLNGSQEFTALEKLYSLYQSGEFDLVVLDTPPTKHAIDFLNAPQKISALFNESIAKWFRRPEGTKGSLFGKVFQAGTQKVFSLLESLTGSGFIYELADFFKRIEKWQSKLEERTLDVHRLLTQTTTSFVLVTNPDKAKLIEASYFVKEIRKGGYSLKSIIVNRAYPKWFQEAGELKAQNHPHWPEAAKLYTDLKSFYESSENIYSQDTDLYKQASLIKIPELAEEVRDLESLEKFSQELAKEL